MVPISKKCRLQIIPVPNSLAAEIVMAETIERREEAEVTVIDITVMGSAALPGRPAALIQWARPEPDGTSAVWHRLAV